MEWAIVGCLALAACSASPRTREPSPGADGALEARLDACPAEHRVALERLRAGAPSADGLRDAAAYRAEIGDLHGALDVLALGRVLWPEDERLAEMQRSFEASPASFCAPATSATKRTPSTASDRRATRPRPC